MRLHVQSYRQWCDTIVSESISLLLGYHLLQCLHTKHTHAQFCAIGHWQRWHDFIFAFSKGDIATCLHFKAGASLTWWSSDRSSTAGSVSALFLFASWLHLGSFWLTHVSRFRVRSLGHISYPATVVFDRYHPPARDGVSEFGRNDSGGFKQPLAIRNQSSSSHINRLSNFPHFS